MATNSNRIDIHRLRFGNYVPNAIQSIARDPFSPLVAVGRVDGDIEIYNSNSKWHVQCTVPGKRFFKLQQLVWSTNSKEKHRLFGVSLRGFVFEVDLKALTIMNIRDSYGGAAWSVCSSTMREGGSDIDVDVDGAANEVPILCVGCEDGTVKVFRYDGRGLEYVKSLITSNGARVLSVAVCARPSTDPVVNASVYVGTAAGYVHCIDRNSGKQHFSIMSDIRKDLHTHIWSLLVTSDHTIITGNNRGHVQLWDGTTAVLLSSIHQHTAEVLALCCSEDEQSIFASGMDSRVVCVRRAGAGQWVYASAHRPHSHEVAALAVCFQRSPLTGAQVPVLLSGGVDTKLCLYGVADFGTVRPVWIIPVPASGLAQRSESRAGRSFVLAQHQSNLDVWCVADPETETDTSTSTPIKGSKRQKTSEAPPASVLAPPVAATGVDLSDNCSLVLQLFPTSVAPKSAAGTSTSAGAGADALEQEASEHIYRSALSSCGELLAVTRVGHTRVYRLQAGTGGRAKKGYTLEPVALPDAIANMLCTDLSFGATVASVDGAQETGFACVTCKSVVFACSVRHGGAAPGKATVLHSVNHNSIVDNNALYQLKRAAPAKPSAAANSAQVVQYMSSLGVPTGFAYCAGATALSPDGQFYCVCDRLNNCFVYNAANKLKVHWVIAGDGPAEECISGARFDPCPLPGGGLRLVLIYSTNRAAFFDVQGKQALPLPWAPTLLKGGGPSHFPAELLNYPAACQGISFVTSRGPVGIYTSALVVYNQGLVAVVKLQGESTPLGKHTAFCQKIKSSADNRANMTKQQRVQEKVVEMDVEPPRSSKKKGRKAEQPTPAEASAAIGDGSTSTFSLITCYRSLVLVGGSVDGSGRLVSWC